MPMDLGMDQYNTSMYPAEWFVDDSTDCDGDSDPNSNPFSIKFVMKLTTTVMKVMKVFKSHSMRIRCDGFGVLAHTGWYVWLQKDFQILIRTAMT